LYGLQDRLSQKSYARGGLSVAARQLAAQGRGGDTELAHINPREAAMLRRAGGSGTINPNTGLREYKFSFKKIKWGKILAAVAPVALSLILPGIGTAIGGFLSGGLLTGTAASALGGAAIGAASSAVGGQNPLVGALTGGIGGGLGSVLGGGVNSALGLGLSEGTANILGGGLAGAGASAVQGKDPLAGAVTGAIGAGISGLGGLGIENANINQAVAGATRGFGNALTAGQSPTEALMAGGLSGLGGLAGGLLGVGNSAQPTATASTQPDATSAAPAVSNPAMNPMATNAEYAGAEANPGITTGSSMLGVQPSTDNIFNGAYPTTASTQSGATPNTFTGTIGSGVGELDNPGVIGGTPATATAPAGSTSGGTLATLGPLLAGGAALAALSNTGSSRASSPQVQQAVAKLPATQQAYLNRPGITWDWDKIAADAASSNVTLDQYLARNWNRVTAGEYNTSRAMAQGGLNAMARFVRGGGTGRSDEINAKLSDGEYVIDAETVAMLGDGSSKAGAQRLDEMRAAIRKHKGKVMARGKFSPDAKSPLSYLKGIS
jgi:hypothetical protein